MPDQDTPTPLDGGVTDAAPATAPAAVSQQPESQSGAQLVSNPQPAPLVQDADANHPLIQNASWIHKAAQTLAGGPRFAESIDVNTGKMTRTQLPMSRADIGLAIAMEAISGSLAGFTQTGPGAVGRAAAAGAQAVMQQRQQVDQQQDQNAKEDSQQQAQAIARSAAAYESNARALLNTAQAERYGVDSLKDAVSQNASLLSGYADAGEVLDSHLSQDALMAGMKAGTYSPTSQIAIADGFTHVNGRYEQTFSVIRNPSAKVPVTQEQIKEFADNAVPGFASFRSGGKIPAGFEMQGTILAKANAQMTANKLMLSDVADVRKALSESDEAGTRDLAKNIPDFRTMLSDPQTGPTLATALGRFQKYVSHSDNHGMDLYQSLRHMAAPSKPDPQNPKQMVPNNDASFASTIAGAFGNGDPQRGWSLLQAYSGEIAPEKIENEAQASDMIASSEPGSRPYKYAQRWIAANTAQKARIAGATTAARDAAYGDSGSSAGGSKVTQPAPASLTKPDALGFTPTVTDPKVAEKHFSSFHKSLDELSRTEQSFTQFRQALDGIDHGNWSGADSVVALFNAIGLSAAPLAGKGFRVSQNVIDEHRTARGWQGALQARLQGLKTGAVITPQQLKDYANIAASARQNQYVAVANEMHNAGIGADAALPTGNGQHLDAGTAHIFLQLAGGNKDKARQAATAKGWAF